jgi:phosphatidylglycerophosphate synthase
MTESAFAGDKKAPMRSPLANIEKKFILANVERFPSWIQTNHLTLLTVPWSIGLIVFGYLAQFNIHWLWGSSLMLFLQWFTDTFDGAIGRHRNTGLVKWGYYMDHFLDFVFMWCVPVGYVFIVSGAGVYQLFVVAFLYSALNVNAFLSFACSNEFKITYLGVGPTEVRLLFILLNAVLVFVGPWILEIALPYLLVVMSLCLVAIVYRTQKAIWALDMEKKGATQ